MDTARVCHLVYNLSLIGGGEIAAFNICARSAFPSKVTGYFRTPAHSENKSKLETLQQRYGLDIAMVPLFLTPRLSLPRNKLYRALKFPPFLIASTMMRKKLLPFAKAGLPIQIHGGLPFAQTPFNALNALTSFGFEKYKKQVIFTLQSIPGNINDFLKARYVGQFTTVNKELSEKLGIMHIPNGVDTSVFAPGKAAGIDDRCRIIFPARIEPLKRQLEFLQAIEPLKNEVRITFAGFVAHQGYAERLFAYAKENGFAYEVRMYDHEAMPQAYRDADVVAMFSTSEGSPLAMLEAMASGKPFVGPDISGLNDVITNGKDGFLAKNQSEVRAHVAALVQDVSLREKVGRNARQTSLAYDWKRIAQQYDKLYAEILGDKA